MDNLFADPNLAVPDVSSAWLLKSKVVAPMPPAAYVRRGSLLQRLDGILERRLTVLQAPSGFGKTTVLADVARIQKDRGYVVAWLSLDKEDTPGVFGRYVAYAFEHAGLDLSLLKDDAWSSSSAVQQSGMLARAIEAHEAPCLLVLDEVDRPPRRTVHMVDLLIKRAPENLHFGMTFRSDPGFDLAPHMLHGGVVLIGARHLRFSKADIARFFDGNLSRAELATIDKRTEGWPVALVVCRKQRADESETDGADTATPTENYIGKRLLRDLSGADRTALLELAVFDWIEPELVEEVLGSTDGMVRLAALSWLDGLLTCTEGNPAVRLLHPLVRDYCLELLSVEDPDRKRLLHKGIALALARRVQLEPAWRHASAAGDGQLLAELIERFGVFQLWLRDGMSRLISAGRFLTPEILASYPRLELLQCLILLLSLKFKEARELLDAVSLKTDGFKLDRKDGDAASLAIDAVFAQVALEGGVDRASPADIEALLPADGGAKEGTEQAGDFTSARHVLLCMVNHDRARFEESWRHGVLAQSHFGEDAHFGRVFVNLCQGMSAMAQGRVEEASEGYRRARKDIRKFFDSDPLLAMSIDVLKTELDLERNRERAIQQRALKRLPEAQGAWCNIYVAATAVSVELTFAQDGKEAVVQLLTRAVEDVNATRAESLGNHLAAMLAYYLVELGYPEEAAAEWRARGLPHRPAELLDLEKQSWRTMEMLSCARVRLLTEQGENVAAEVLASELCGVASGRGLTRTLMRGLALSMAAAHGGGQTQRALGRLVEFLALAREVDYVRPLVRHGATSQVLLQQLLAGDLDEDTRGVAKSMLAQVVEPSRVTQEHFSSRELEVLVEVGRGLRNKEIASHLGISDEGVRFHLKNIYRKTGSSNRMDAVRYAQSMGFLS